MLILLAIVAVCAVVGLKAYLNDRETAHNAIEAKHQSVIYYRNRRDDASRVYGEMLNASWRAVLSGKKDAIDEANDAADDAKQNEESAERDYVEACRAAGEVP